MLRTMKNKILCFVFCVFGAVCVWQKNQVKSVGSDVFLENVEALADFESMFGPGNKKILSAITEHKYNEEPYQFTAIITCEEGGQYGCIESWYRKDKKTDPWVRMG